MNRLARYTLERRCFIDCYRLHHEAKITLGRLVCQEEINVNYLLDRWKLLVYSTPMNTKNFYKLMAQTLRPPTERKIVNMARKLELRDSLNELVYWLGAYVREAKLQEFRNDGENGNANL